MRIARTVFAFLCVALLASGLAGSASADMPSPLRVELKLPNIPELGQQATLDCEIYAHYSMKGVSLKIELSPGVELIKGSKIWQGDMAAQQTLTLPMAIKVTSPGNKTITATVFCRIDDKTAFSDIGQVFFNSQPGFAAVGHIRDVVATQSAAECLQTGEKVQPMKLADYMKLPLQAPMEPEPCKVGPGETQPEEAGPTPEGTLVVTGRWCYYDRDDTYRPMEWVYVELRRGSDDAVLTSTWVTDNDGRYTFPAITNPGSAGFRVRAWCYHNNTHSSDGKALRVVDVGAGRDDGGNVYNICYSVQTGIRTSGDGTYDMGTWHVVNGDTNEPAWWIMMDLNKAFWWPYWWNDHTTMNGGVTVEWSSTSTHGDHNHRTDDGGNIHLKAASPNVCDVVLHEYGHEVQWDGYGQWLPSSDCPSPHYFEQASGPHCAWYEGFANWFKFAVSNDPVYHWAGGGSLDCENSTWGNYWDTGDQVEGRTAGAMWDIGDANADGYDTCNLSWEYIWDTWYGAANRDNTFAEFWTRWKNRGNPKHHPTKALYQNTIDYNTYPSFGGLPNVTTPEDTPVNNIIDLWAYASDPESSDSELEYTITGNTNPSCGVSIDSGDFVDINPALNWYGSSTVTISCSDGIRTVSDSFVVTVTAVNDPPVITGLPDRTLNEDTSWNNAIDLWAYASDPESGPNGLTYTIVANTNSNCGVSIDSMDYVDINPTANWYGYSDVTIRATDPQGAWSQDTFRITVNPVNDPPVLSTLPDRQTNEDTPYNNAIDLWAYASDVDNSDSELTFTITANTNPSC
ncbi:MAG: Ig-like domain-containing protein, partial [Armatimonadota bacterium]|nr:Ig-like domain-containing protein [Armatimonadota bacterium]